MVLLALALHVSLAAADPAAPPTDAAPVEHEAVAPGEAVRTADTGPRAVTPAALAPALTAPAPSLRAITLVPRELDPGPFRRPGELVGATAGAFVGDALVLAAGYETLQLFANGTFSPSATNFRRAVYGFGAAALVVPPLTAVLFAKLGAGRNASGSLWKAMLLASVGQAAALAAGYYAAPHFWVVLPVQAIALSVGASLGLHWGPSRGQTIDADGDADAGREPADPPPEKTAAVAALPLCTDS
jgi:hypothetical protein